MYSIKTVNPTNNELVKGYPELTPDEINDRITQEEKALKTWDKTANKKRADLSLHMAHQTLHPKEKHA